MHTHTHTHTHIDANSQLAFSSQIHECKHIHARSRNAHTLEHVLHKRVRFYLPMHICECVFACAYAHTFACGYSQTYTHEYTQQYAKKYALKLSDTHNCIILRSHRITLSNMRRHVSMITIFFIWRQFKSFHFTYISYLIETHIVKVAFRTVYL